MSGGDWKDMSGAACRGDLAGHQDVAGLQIDHGADVDLMSTADRLTPLQAARQAGLPSIQERLQALGAQ